jgi:hypothetical protein
MNDQHLPSRSQTCANANGGSTHGLGDFLRHLRYYALHYHGAGTGGIQGKGVF